MIILLCSLITISIASNGECCTTVIAGFQTTEDGKILHAHLEDMGISAAGKLWYETRRSTQTNYIDVPYVRMPQPRELKAYWASGNADGTHGLGIESKTLAYDNVLVGFNENEVVMSCNWCYSRENNELQKGIRRYAMRQLLLEQAHSARDGVSLIGQWIDEYGQADWGGLAFQLSDANEAWIVETTSHQWAARKIGKDEIFCMANRFTIGEDFDMCSKNLLSFAQTEGWYDGFSKFNFADVYTLPERRASRYDVEREDRLKSLLLGKTLCTEILLNVFQDRYEGTELFMIPSNMQEIWEAESEQKNIPRPICTNLAQSFFIAEHTNAYSDFVFYIGMGTPGYSGIVPIFKQSSEISTYFPANKDSSQSAWNIFKDIQLKSDEEYDLKSFTEKQKWNVVNNDTIYTSRKLQDKAIANSQRNSYTLSRSKEIIAIAMNDKFMN